METHYRSIIKAVSWRTGGTIVTCLVAWYLTGSLDLATRIGIVDTAIKIGAFFLPLASMEPAEIWQGKAAGI